MVLLGRKIKDLRNKYRLTQSELALQIGVTKSTVAAYENDSRTPSYEVLIKLANVFKVRIDSLIMDRSETIIDVNGLTPDQLQIIESLIVQFQNANKMEELINKYNES